MMDDLIIMAPDRRENIPDVFIYLSLKQKKVDKERICYIRLNAEALFNKEWKIEKFKFVEDISIDALSDEEFPGILFCKIKAYEGNPTDTFESGQLVDMNKYSPYLLNMHVYMGRNFPPADESGAADPFISIRCQGETQKTSIKYETLNPGWFESRQMVIDLPPLEKGQREAYPTPGISLLVYDHDAGFFGAKKDLLGRVWIDIVKPDQSVMIKQYKDPSKKYRVAISTKPTWHKLYYDA
jgi:hypothetical protein